MMVDSGPAAQPGAAANASPEKDRAGNGDYACGGWKSEDGSLTCGYSSFRGQRVSMEDYCDLKSTKIDGHTVHLFGIFDGHGGSHAAEYLKEHLFENLMRHPQFMSDTKLALSETYKKTDSDFLAAESNTSRDDGSTASTAVLIGKHLYVANVGDSRAVISKTGKAIPLSNDHKPNRSDERKRIEDAGGVVTWTGTWRVGGILAMSRAFGNRLLKRFVVAEPEIQEQVVDEELEILVLASDSSPPAAAELPQKRAAASDASKRPAKKATTPKAASDLAVGKSVTKEVTLRNQEEKEVVFLDTFREQGVVFFMYPRANTPGCTKQACGFRDNIQAIKDAGFTVYGLSGDSPKSLSNWKAKQNLPFDLLSDPEHQLISYFGSSLPGKKVQRSHVVILKGGVVGDIQAKVSPADSVSRAVAFVKENSGEPAKLEEPAKEEEPADAVDKFAVGNTITFDAELQTDASTSVKVQDLFKTRGAIFFMYPKADTPGCTTQACGYNDNLEVINAAGFDVYGLGADTPAELLAWKESQKYKYTLLSDPKHQLIGYFGSSINDGTRVERSHVIVLPGGKVGQIEHNISPQDSVSKGLEFAKNHAVDAASKL